MFIQLKNNRYLNLFHMMLRHCLTGCDEKVLIFDVDHAPFPIVSVIERDAVSTLDGSQNLFVRPIHNQNGAIFDKPVFPDLS